MNNYVADYYDRAVKRYGSVGWQAALWSSPHVQEKCFMNFINTPLGHHGSLLEVGCGQCDFFKYLTNLRPRVIYQGIDICSAMIQIAKQKHKGVAAFTQDFLDDGYTPSADYIVAAGPFNLMVPGVDMEERVKKAIGKMYSCCKKAMAVDLTSKMKHGGDPDIYYYDPKQILDFAFTLTDKVGFRHGRVHYGMTLYLHKEDDDD